MSHFVSGIYQCSFFFFFLRLFSVFTTIVTMESHCQVGKNNIAFSVVPCPGNSGYKS